MTIINLTPHNFDVYAESSFVNLERVNATTLIADSVEGNAILSLPSVGSIRINTTTVEGEPINGIPTVVTKYGDAVGIPEGVQPEDVLVVSLQALSMAVASKHPLASQMTSPYKVVRLRSNTSIVLGAMGLSFQ
jgi:hypothetical protein